MARRRARHLIRLRAALYWAPEPQDPLGSAGSSWLGRDAELDAPVPQPDVPGIADITRAPCLYGFHATLRPPMRLATGWEEFTHAARTIAAHIAPFDMPSLRVVDIDGFLAIGLAAPCPALHQLANACVAGTDPHRLRADAAELASRRAAGLTPEQDVLLLRWGYPYVMHEWRFHITLTRRLARAEMAILRPAAEAHFAPSLQMERRCTGIAVFTQRDNESFLIGERIGLGK